MSIIANLEFILKKGIRVFIKWEGNQWEVQVLNY